MDFSFQLVELVDGWRILHETLCHSQTSHKQQTRSSAKKWTLMKSMSSWRVTYSWDICIRNHLAGPKFEQSYTFIHFLSPQIFRLLRLTFWWILALCIQWGRHEVSSCLLLWWKWSGEFVGVGLVVEWKGSLQFHGFKWIFILMLVALVVFAWNIIPLGRCVIKISQGAKTTIMDYHYTNNYISLWYGDKSLFNVAVSGLGIAGAYIVCPRKPATLHMQQKEQECWTLGEEGPFRTAQHVQFRLHIKLL